MGTWQDNFCNSKEIKRVTLTREHEQIYIYKFKRVVFCQGNSLHHLERSHVLPVQHATMHLICIQSPLIVVRMSLIPAINPKQVEA